LRVSARILDGNSGIVPAPPSQRDTSSFHNEPIASPRQWRRHRPATSWPLCGGTARLCYDGSDDRSRRPVAAMALLFRSSVDSAARWRAQLTRLTQELEIRLWSEVGDPAEIDYALVWRPEPGLLASLPNLKLILSLGAGVDHLLGDPQLPRHLPIVRLVDPYMTDAMSEYVVLQVLRLHRHDLDYRVQQEARVWRELDQ